MKTYLVAIASMFNGTNKLYEVKANTPNEAKAKALRDAGWEVNDDLHELPNK